RVYLWMSWKYGVEGFECWNYNFWQKNQGGDRARWPDIPWDARSFKEYNCDGMLMYPGPGGTPCSSLRYENLRDGIQDCESLYVLRAYADVWRAAGGNAELFKKADALFDVPDELVSSVVNYSQNRELLLKPRQSVAETIVAIKNCVPNAAYEKVRDK